MMDSATLKIILSLLALTSVDFRITAETVDYPSSVVFLNVAPNQIDGRFELKDGRIYQGDDGLRPMENAPPIPDSLARATGPGQYILGAPAFVHATAKIDVPDSLAAAGGTFSATAVGGNLYLVHETRFGKESSVNGALGIFTVYHKVGVKMERVGAFGFKDNLFNQYLTHVWPIDDHMLGIVTRSSRHVGIKTLFLFDLTEEKLVGMREFSRFQFMPTLKSFWFAASVPNCDNLEDMLADAKRTAAVFPIYQNGKLNGAFMPLTDMTLAFGDTGDSSQSPTSGNTTNTSPGLTRSNNTPNTESKQEAEKNELPSINWFVWPALIVIVIGFFLISRKNR